MPQGSCSRAVPSGWAWHGQRHRSPRFQHRAAVRILASIGVFCKIGCATNAKQSALLTWIPRAIAAGAEIRDLATVSRIEMDSRTNRAIGVNYHRFGEWRLQRAKHVVVAGYAVETPRLLLNSACNSHPHGLANSSGLVGKNLMVHSNHAVWGVMDDEIRWYKGPPSMAVCEHWNYEDNKDFAGVPHGHRSQRQRDQPSRTHAPGTFPTFESAMLRCFPPRVVSIRR